MSNVLKTGKKIFTVGVTFTTMLWSVLGSAFFVMLPASAASCPALSAGEMIKVSGKPAIYTVNNDLKVLYFPSGDEFKSWNVTDSYGGYTTVNQECFDSLQVPSTYPGAANYRPGSWVVKRPSSDQLYVVEPGNKLAKVTLAAAKALYGSAFKTMTVADPFWPHYVNRGPDVTEAKVHPGMLVANGGKTWYVDDSSMLREVTASGMTANRFKSAFVHVATDAMIAGLSFGSQITAEVPAVSDRTQSGGITGGTLPGTTGGSLNVSLAADNPFAATIVSDNLTSTTSNGAQAMIPVLKLNLMAGTDGDAKVTMLRLKRAGISADTDISNMYLYDGETKLASNPSVSNNAITFTNLSGLVTIAKGTTKSITVKLDLKNNVSAGKTYTFSVASNSDVSAGGSVSGSFPVMGNTFTSASVTDLGKLVFTNVSPTAAGTVDPGTANFEVWRFTAASTNQDMEIRKMVFTLVGSVNPGDLKNFALWDGSTQIGTTVADMSSDKLVVLDLSAKPHLITKGQTRTLSLKADVVGGTNRTFYASIQNSGDIVTFDKNYGVFVKTNGTDTFTTLQAGGTSSVNYTINVGSLTQTLAADSPTGNIADGATNITMAKFLWKANGEDVKISSLSVSSTSSGNTISNLRLLVNGSQVGSSVASHTASNGADTGWGTFGNSFIIPAGTTATVTVVGDTSHSSVAANDTIVIGLSAGSSNAQGTVSLTNISSVGQTGNTLTVKSGTVTVTKNASFGDKSSTNPTGTVNATNVKLASLVVTAGAGEDVEISQIILADDDATNCIGDHVQNLAVKNSAGVQLGTTYANPSATCTTANSYTFNVSPAVTVANGGQYVVDVYGDLKASLTTADTLVASDSITASGKTTGSDASYSTNVSLQQSYIAAAGAFMVQVDSDTAVGNNYLMGATDQNIGKFKITASSTEAVNITQLVVSARFSTGATGTMANIRLVDDSTGLQVGPTVSSFSDTVAGTASATTTYSHATFSGMNLTVAKGVSKSLSLKVDFTTYEGSGFSTTGQTVAPVILQIYTGTSGNNPVTATGASSGTSLTATISNTGSAGVTGGLDITSGSGGTGAFGNTTTLYRAKLTTAWASDTPSGASSPSASQTVAKFVINNLANAGAYTATVNKVDFDLSTTISQAITSNNARTLTVYKDSLSTTALGSTAAGNATHNFQDTNITESTFTDVDIASGATKTFYVTLDTSDAASAKSLSIRIGSSDVTWTDGVSSSLTVMGTDLPLVYKTFTY